VVDNRNAKRVLAESANDRYTVIVVVAITGANTLLRHYCFHFLVPDFQLFIGQATN
jgi:hypothetical protein